MGKNIIDTQLIKEVPNFTTTCLITSLKLILLYIILRISKYIIYNLLLKCTNDITLQAFLKSIINMFYFILLITIALNIVGILNQSYIAGLTIGFFTAVGFAMRDNLKTLINGIIILISKTLKIGDMVTIENTYGRVIEINIFQVKIRTLENKIIIVDNGIIFRNSITRVNENKPVRQDIIISIYNKQNNIDIEQIKTIIKYHINECPIILKKEDSKIIISDISYDYTEFTVQIWSLSVDKLQVKSYINQNVSISLNKSNLNI